MKIAQHLEKIQKRLPTWFHMRIDNESIGARFLNVMGMTLDDVKEILDYAYQQRYIETADLNQVDIVYRAGLPSTIAPETKINVRSRHMDLLEASSLEQFMTSLQTDKLNHTEVFYDNPYYMDYEHRYIYVRKAYDITKEFPEGRIRLITYDGNGKEVVTELTLNMHHVWNFFDEFGLLLNTPRIYGERNAEYKERILDVFRRPANATRRGMYNGIARELGLMQKKTWLNGAEDLMIRDSRVDIESMHVDGKPWPLDLIEVDASGRVILTGDYSFEGIERTASYTYGVTMHELHNERDLAFHELLFDIDGHGTTMLQYYVDIVNDKVPIMWDHFVWGLSFWDVADPETSGYGVIPTFFDAKFLNWKNYKVKSKA